MEYGLIHSYNTTPFKNYNVAKVCLEEKILKSGEVSFAYYYDDKVDSGINVIYAVGGLNNSGNIVFMNANQLLQICKENELVCDDKLREINAIQAEILTANTVFKNSLTELITAQATEINELKDRVAKLEDIINNFISESQ